MHISKHAIKKSTEYHPAFTIVELLVVIVVIGILATITIVSYTGISAKAIDASITTDLSNAFKKFKIHQVENGGYPTTIDCSTPNSASNICLKPSPNNQYTLTTDNSVASNQYFCISILNTTSNKRSYIANSGITGTGVCPIFTLTTIAGANGTVTAGGIYYPGSIPTITATPNSGYKFKKWTGSTGCNNVTTASFTITIDSDKTCTANFIDANWIAGVGGMAGKYVYNTNAPGTYTWGNPIAGCATGGRWPTIAELQAIYINRASYGNNFQPTYYWSSDEYDIDLAYIVNFSDGVTDTGGESASFYVRCVLN